MVTGSHPSDGSAPRHLGTVAMRDVPGPDDVPGAAARAGNDSGADRMGCAAPVTH
jgi:hypothetical protein